MDPLIDLPTHCIICYNFITSGQSVLLHCECVLAMCQSCAYAQIAVQHYTYLRGLTCPSCRIASYNISGIEKCQLEEKKLVQSAAKFFCRSKSKVEPSEKQLLIRAIKSGYESSMSLAELEATDGVNLGVPLEASMIRLELARLESRRLAKLHHGDGNDLGPLVYLRISRNIFLEAAIELSMKLKGTCSNNDAFSRMKEIAQTTGFDAIVNPNPNQIPVIRTSTSNIESYSEDSEQQQEKAKPKQLCVCGDEEDGFYVQCTNGTGGCNGWVHPECIPRLRGNFFEFNSLVKLRRNVQRIY